MKTLSERLHWLSEYISGHGAVDVLDSDFVDDYIAATKVRFSPTAWGAYKCPTLGRDLALLWKRKILNRGRIGLAGNWQPGFPKWVWTYSKPKP